MSEHIKTEDWKNKLFKQFFKEYLENVTKTLPDSFRAKQLNAGGIEREAVYVMEISFLMKPFMKALSDSLSSLKAEIEKKNDYFMNLPGDLKDIRDLGRMDMLRWFLSLLEEK